MRLSNKTLEVLKNFSNINQNILIEEGNVVRTISTMKNILGSAIVDENLKNYMEMYNWVKNIGFPFEHAQFNKLERPDFMNRSGGQKYHAETDTYSKVEDEDLYTDIFLQIMSAKNNLIAQCEIYDAFPTTLGAIEYSQQETDMTYAMCEVGFAYSWFDMKPVTSAA